MNTYNENLHNTVVTVLSKLQTEHRSQAAQLNSAEAQNQYAQEAAQAAGVKLQLSKVDLSQKLEAKQLAQNAGYISTNVVVSVTQAKQYCGQSVTNVSVSAANVQVAANAIVRLAGNIGSINSVVKAADYGTMLYNITETVNILINIVAHDAEIASKLAMEASYQTAEIIASTIFDEAKSTDALMQNLISKITTDANEYTAAVAANDAILLTTLTNANITKGGLTIAASDEAAAANALKQANKQLNLDLDVSVETETKFKASFDAIKDPFSKTDTDHIDIVDAYYLILVKDSQQSLFTLSNAEGLLFGLPQSFAQITQVPIDKNEVLNQTFDVYQMQQKDGPAYILKDSDGDDITGGQNYVMFLLAVYTDKYKKNINDFDDFLSAPSGTFKLVNKPGNAIPAKASHRPVVVKNRKYGITEQKKAELDALTAKIIEAQYQVELLQINVNALANTLTNQQAVLSTTQAAQTNTYNDRNLVDGLIQSANQLQHNAGIAYHQALNADKKTGELAGGIATLINKLIYAVELLNKLANMVIRQKALNALISDELISFLATAGTDANNAVALTLIALQSTVAAQASNIETKAAAGLVNIGAKALYDNLTGANKAESIKSHLHAAYINAEKHYNEQIKTTDQATQHVNKANADLAKHQVELKSLQMALAAANAAALAS